MMTIKSMNPNRIISGLLMIGLLSTLGWSMKPIHYAWENQVFSQPAVGVIAEFNKNDIQDRIILKSITRENGYVTMNKYLLTVQVDSAYSMDSLLNQFPDAPKSFQTWIKANARFDGVIYTSLTSAQNNVYINGKDLAKVVAYYQNQLDIRFKKEAAIAKREAYLAKEKEKNAQALAAKKAPKIKEPIQLQATVIQPISQETVFSVNYYLEESKKTAYLKSLDDYRKKLAELKYTNSTTYAIKIEQYAQNGKQIKIEDYMKIKDTKPNKDFTQLVVKSTFDLRKLRNTLEKLDTAKPVTK